MSTGAVGEQHRVGAVEVDRRSEVANRLVVPPFLEGGVALGHERFRHRAGRGGTATFGCEQSKQRTFPILANILFATEGKRLTLTGTDMEVELKSSSMLEDDVSTASRITLPGKKLHDTLFSEMWTFGI